MFTKWQVYYKFVTTRIISAAQVVSVLGMPKLKTGRRHHHSAIKKHYNSRHHYQSSHPQDISNCQSHSPVNNAIITPLDDLAPTHIPPWHVSKTSNNLELSFLEGSSPSIVKFSTIVEKNLTWSVMVHGKLLSVDN